MRNSKPNERYVWFSFPPEMNKQKFNAACSALTLTRLCAHTLLYLVYGVIVTEAVLVNGHCFQVTTNLTSALHHIRFLIPDGKQYLLCIDAICINQEDLDERRA
jgi:hypothetical protein